MSGGVVTDHGSGHGADQRATRVVSGWQLRAALSACCLLAVAAAVAGQTADRLGPVSLAGTALLVLLTVLAPASWIPLALLVVCALAVADREAVAPAQLVALAAALHAVHLLAGVCGLAPAATRFELVALRPAAVRWGIAQLVALPVVVVVQLTQTRWRPGDLSALGESAGLQVELGAGALAVLLVVALVALARRRMR